MKRKNFYLFLLAFVFNCNSNALHAQDIIVLKNKTTIKAKVLTISINGIEYKNFENLEGPICKLPVNDIFSLQYENGVIENLSIFQTQITEESPKDEKKEWDSSNELFVRANHTIYNYYGEELDKNEIKNILKICPEALDVWQSSFRAKRASIAMMILTPAILTSGVVCATLGFWAGLFGDESLLWIGTTCMLPIGIFTGIMIPVTLTIRNRCVQEAVSMYNGYLRAKTKLSLNFGITPSGNVGFLVKF
jgi:hypothetical protein